MEAYEHDELYNSFEVPMSPDEEFLEWAIENCPLPSDEELERREK